MTKKAQRLGAATAILVVAVALSRVLGFLRDAVVAALFGASGKTDAFYAAFTIPDILNYLVAGGTLSITFIPIYTRYLTSNDEAEGNRVLSIIATVMTVVLGVGIVVLECITPQVAARYLHKLSPEDLQTAISLTRILLPAQIFFYLGGLCSATLFARHRFTAAALAPLIYNFGTIAGGLLFGRRLGIASLAWGSVAGAFVGPFLLQAIAAGRAGVRYRPSFAARHPDFRAWLILSVPLMIGVSLVTADEWILRYFAAADLGAISRLSYARKLVLVPIALAGQAVGQASMPFFARLYAEGKRDELGALVAQSARRSAEVAMLAACGMIALSIPLIDLLFRRGHFRAEDVAPTAQYLSIFALSVPVWAMQGIFSRAFYSTSDTRTPMIAGTLITIGSLPIYYLANRMFGVPGLVIASDIGIILHTAVLMILLPRRVSCDRSAVLAGVARAAILGALAGAAAWMVARHLPVGALAGHSLDLVQLGAAGLTFLSVVIALAKPLKVEGVRLLLDRFSSLLYC